MFFFFNDTATTEIYTLSLHDALPIFRGGLARPPRLGRRLQPGRHLLGGDCCGRTPPGAARDPAHPAAALAGDRKSTRLNSSHAHISYAVFCLKKKTQSSSLCS